MPNGTAGPVAGCASIAGSHPAYEDAERQNPAVPLARILADGQLAYRRVGEWRIGGAEGAGRRLSGVPASRRTGEPAFSARTGFPANRRGARWRIGEDTGGRNHPSPGDVQ